MVSQQSRDTRKRFAFYRGAVSCYTDFHFQNSQIRKKKKEKKKKKKKRKPFMDYESNICTRTIIYL